MAERKLNLYFFKGTYFFRFIDGSVLEIILFIFSLCKSQINATNTPEKKTFSSASATNKKMGQSKELPRAATDDFLEIIAMIIQEKHTSAPTMKFMASIIPKKTATPLPPLNL